MRNLKTFLTPKVTVDKQRKRNTKMQKTTRLPSLACEKR